MFDRGSVTESVEMNLLSKLLQGRQEVECWGKDPEEVSGAGVALVAASTSC